MQLKNENFLTTVNLNLLQLVEIVTNDYQRVNSALVQFLKEASRDAELTKCVDQVVQELQYTDVLSQRVQHLVLVHEMIFHQEDERNFKESFFHLHVFQSLTIELDLLDSMCSLESSLNAMWSTGLSEFFPEGENIFRCKREVKERLQNTITNMSAEAGEIHKLPIPPLSAHQISMLNDLYTMERERVVLAWFLRSMPYGTWEQLCEHYQRTFTKIEIENTELF